MTDQKMLEIVDDVLHLPPGTVTGGELLETLDGWDSLSMIEFVAVADERFGVDVTPEDVRKSKHVDDLVKLLAVRV